MSMRTILRGTFSPDKLTFVTLPMMMPLSRTGAPTASAAESSIKV